MKTHITRSFVTVEVSKDEHERIHKHVRHFTEKLNVIPSFADEKSRRTLKIACQSHLVCHGGSVRGVDLGLVDPVRESGDPLESFRERVDGSVLHESVQETTESDLAKVSRCPGARPGTRVDPGCIVRVAMLEF